MDAIHAYKPAIAQMKAEVEGVEITVGRETLPLFTSLTMAWESLMQTIFQDGGPDGFDVRGPTWAARRSSGT